MCETEIITYTKEKKNQILKESIYSTSIFNLEINFKKVRTPIQSFKPMIVYNAATHMQ